MNRNSINDISANRKQKKQIKVMASVLVISAIMIFGLLVVFNWDVIISPFEGIGQRIPGRRSGTEIGFPVRLPGSTNYSIGGFDGGFMLLTETYIYAYGANGGQRYALQHGYSAPQSAIANRRILVYDKNGKQFSYFSRNGLIYEKNTENMILYGAIGENGSVAIVYRSAVYANVLEIFDDKGDWRYTKRFSDENIMQIDFTSSDNDIIVTTIGFDEGTLTAAVTRFDRTSEDEKGLWRADLPINTLPLAIHTDGSVASVLCDNALFVLDSNNGDIIGKHEYRGTLVDFAFAGDLTAFLVNDFTAGRINLITLDRRAENFKMVEVSPGASQVEIHNDTIGVLQPGAIVFFKGKEAEMIELLELQEEFSGFVKSGDEVLLLGYNTVEKLGDSD
jgi:hypothetical protein